jgi:16S rRNA (guanine527-N7)-methyltransferase
VHAPEKIPVAAWFRETLEAELGNWLALSAEQILQLWRHYEILIRWSQKINLTSVPPGRELVVRHYCESLFFGVHLPASDASKIIDLGSGAGFPGVPLAILKPAWHLTLLESNQKKAVFLREATRGVSNIAVLAQRAEDAAGGYDWVVSRAVDPEVVLREVPRLAPRVGLMIGEDDYQKIRSRSEIAWSEPIRLPWGDRRLCVFGEVSCFT